MRAGFMRLSSAHVLALVALFVALAGGAYAVATAPKNSVTSKSVKNESLLGKDIEDNTLKGADIDESKLTDPDEVFFDQRVPTGTAFANLASLGGVTFQISCGAPGLGSPTLFFSIPDGFSLEGATNAGVGVRQGPLTGAGASDMPDENGSAIYQHEFRGADGTIMSATVGITSEDSKVGTDCVFYGSMRVGNA